MFSRSIMQYCYGRWPAAEALPWHVDSPPVCLERSLDEKDFSHQRALDVGCGAGTHSLYLAKRGFEVTAIDVNPVAIGLGREASARQGLDIDWRVEDALTWAPAERFDLIFDRGCMHSLPSHLLPTYKQQLHRWLRAGGVFVLVHVGKRHTFDFNPIGPYRRTRSRIHGVLGPEFTEEFHVQEADSRPFAFGPCFRSIGYCFRQGHA